MITLKRLEANNFKSLRSVTLVFPEHGTVLIEGHNEAGKSTLFEAVYVALYGKPLLGEDKAEVRAASAEEAALAERLDAVKVAIQVKRLTDLEEQKEEIEKRQAGCLANVRWRFV